MAPFVKPETLKSYTHFIVLRFICMCVYTCVYICMMYAHVMYRYTFLFRHGGQKRTLDLL